MKLHNSEVICFCNSKNVVKSEFKKQLVLDRVLPRLIILLFLYRNIVNRPLPPVILRADIFKNEIREAESMKYKLENKDLDIKEVKKVLKNKTEEMSEMQVRKDKAEKRLQDANREAELMREKLQRKLGMNLVYNSSFFILKNPIFSLISCNYHVLECHNFS